MALEAQTCVFVLELGHAPARIHQTARGAGPCGVHRGVDIKRQLVAFLAPCRFHFDDRAVGRNKRDSDGRFIEKADEARACRGRDFDFAGWSLWKDKRAQDIRTVLKNCGVTTVEMKISKEIHDIFNSDYELLKTVV